MFSRIVCFTKSEDQPDPVANIFFPVDEEKDPIIVTSFDSDIIDEDTMKSLLENSEDALFGFLKIKGLHMMIDALVE